MRLFLGKSAPKRCKIKRKKERKRKKTNRITGQTGISQSLNISITQIWMLQTETKQQRGFFFFSAAGSCVSFDYVAAPILLVGKQNKNLIKPSFQHNFKEKSAPAGFKFASDW